MCRRSLTIVSGSAKLKPAPLNPGAILCRKLKQWCSQHSTELEQLLASELVIALACGLRGRLCSAMLHQNALRCAVAASSPRLCTGMQFTHCVAGSRTVADVMNDLAAINAPAALPAVGLSAAQSGADAVRACCTTAVVSVRCVGV